MRVVVSTVALIAAVVCVSGCQAGSDASGVRSTSAAITQPANGGATPTSESSGAAMDAAECRTDQLSVAMGGKGGAEAMHSYFALAFTNTSAVACTMQGYPGVSYTNGPDGDPIGKPADRDHADNATPVTVVRLDPGARASAKIASLNGQGPYSTADCKPVAEKGLRIYPPDNKSSLFLELPGTTCSSQALTTLTVQAVQSGVAS